MCNLVPKLQRLLRIHRQHVFDEPQGETHMRAIARLKRTATFAALCHENYDRSQTLLGDLLTGRGY